MLYHIVTDTTQDKFPNSTESAATNNNDIRIIFFGKIKQYFRSRSLNQIHIGRYTSSLNSLFCFICRLYRQIVVVIIK